MQNIAQNMCMKRLQPRYGPERPSITHVLAVVQLVNQVQEIIPATRSQRMSFSYFLLYHCELELTILLLHSFIVKNVDTT